MAYEYFSRDGHVLPAAEAVVPLGDIEYSYGFGVYETIRVSKGSCDFLGQHCDRLMESARTIALAHPFSSTFVAESIQELIRANKAENCNVKVLLIGGSTPEKAVLNILCLNPLFPDRKLYRQGVHTITVDLERPFPHAKTLNMLPSYLARRDAKAAGAYDALLINRNGCIIEGTTTNFFALKDRVIFSPPESDILLGVTRANVLKTARANGFTVTEQDIPLADIERYDNLFLTGTSCKIMPVRSVGEHTWDAVSPDLKELIRAFDEFLAVART